VTVFAPWQTPYTVSVLLEGPAEEPLTLDEGKLRAGLSWPTTQPPDPRDQLMRDHIAAARSQVERDTGLALLTQTREIFFYTLPGGQVALPMQGLPLQEVLEVTPAPEDARWYGFFSVGPPALAPAFAGMCSGVARVKVGYLNPADLRAKAPLLVQAVGLLTAHFATAGRDAVITGTIASPNPQGYEEAVQSYRLVWLP
jgi:hypothetical protein